MKIKKYIIIILFVFAPFFAFSQVGKIGLTKTELINSFNVSPCKSDFNSIWYCIENGSRLAYAIENDIVRSELQMSIFPSKEEAEANVRLEVADAQRRYGKPIMKGDQANWFIGNLLMLLSYGYSNGQHYSCKKVSLR